jgi:hypothetical protein
MKLKANWVHQMALYEVEGQAWYSEDGLEWFAQDGSDILDCQFFSSEITLYGGPEDGETVGLDLDEMYATSSWAAADHLYMNDRLVLIETAKAGSVVAYRWVVTDDHGHRLHGHPCMHLSDVVGAVQLVVGFNLKEEGDE